MNPTQIGDFLKTALTALGASSAVAGYFTSEAGIAVIGALVAVGSLVWQFMTRKSNQLIEAVAADPEVKEVVVTSPELAVSIPSNKVVVTKSR